MYQQKTIIDSNGYVVDRCVIFEDGIAHEFALVDGLFAVAYLTKTQVINGRTVGYLKPQWTGTEWIETATQEELDVVYPPLPTIQPTKVELLEKQLLETQATLANLQEQILLNQTGGM